MLGKLLALHQSVMQNPVDYTVKGESSEDEQNFIALTTRVNSVLPDLISAANILIEYAPDLEVCQRLEGEVDAPTILHSEDLIGQFEVLEIYRRNGTIVFVKNRNERSFRVYEKMMDLITHQDKKIVSFSSRNELNNYILGKPAKSAEEGQTYSLDFKSSIIDYFGITIYSSEDEFSKMYGFTDCDSDSFSSELEATEAAFDVVFEKNKEALNHFPKLRGTHYFTSDIFKLLDEQSKQDDLDAACYAIQDVIGVDSGDVAGVFFSDEKGTDWTNKSSEWRFKTLVDYISYEMAVRNG